MRLRSFRSWRLKHTAFLAIFHKSDETYDIFLDDVLEIAEDQIESFREEVDVQEVDSHDEQSSSVSDQIPVVASDDFPRTSPFFLHFEIGLA